MKTWLDEKLGIPGFKVLFTSALTNFKVDDQHAAARRRFRSAMRRHEDRARALGGQGLAAAELFRAIRHYGDMRGEPDGFRDWARRLRGAPTKRLHTLAFLYERVADAVERLRAEVPRPIESGRTSYLAPVGHAPYGMRG